MSLIYPRCCEACENVLYKHEYLICNLCEINLPKSNFHKNPANPIYQTLAGRVPLSFATSLYRFEKGSRVQKLLHGIKYKQQQQLAEKLGELLYLEIKEEPLFNAVEIIIPIPLHPEKLKSRGYNQSEAIARGLNSVLNKTLDNECFQKSTETQTQTSKRKFERWENIDGSFILNNKEKLRNKHVLLVDDVITTGATVEAAWQCFKSIEGLTLSLVCVAFAEK